MEFRIAIIRLLIAELQKSAINNRKSSFKDNRNHDWHSTGTVEYLKNAPQSQRTNAALRMPMLAGPSEHEYQ